MKQYTEYDIENALIDVDNGISVRKAAREHGVPRSTLMDRLAGALPSSIAFQTFQALSPVQEEHSAQ